jgi:hypothetical protein
MTTNMILLYIIVVLLFVHPIINNIVSLIKYDLEKSWTYLYSRNNEQTFWTFHLRNVLFLITYKVFRYLKRFDSNL